ncbi:MAG: DinB family protein [Gemmatimonadales bacterium]
MAELRPKLAELLEYMDATRRRLVETVNHLNPTFAAIRPRDGAWSAAETLNHLAIVEKVVVPMMTKAIDAGRAAGVGPDESDEPIIASLDRFRMTEPVTKVTAPSRISPTADTTVEQSLAMLEESRSRLRAAFTDNADLNLVAITAPHRMLGEMNMYQWGLFVAQHEERHRKQIEQAMSQVTELAAECAPIV